MQKTNDNTNGVRGIINRAKTYNSEIGNYIEHFINERFAYTVRLTNGRIEVPSEMAHDQEIMPSSIAEERIQAIASRFQSNNPKPISKQEINFEPQNETNVSSPKPQSFWSKLLKVLGLK